MCFLYFFLIKPILTWRPHSKIAKLTNTPKGGMTTLEKEILRFVIIICSLMIFFNIVVIICWGAWLRKSHPGYITVGDLIIDIVTVAVAFVPEGLPIALTASLTITAAIMKSNQVCHSYKGSRQFQSTEG